MVFDSESNLRRDQHLRVSQLLDGPSTKKDLLARLNPPVSLNHSWRGRRLNSLDSADIARIQGGYDPQVSGLITNPRVEAVPQPIELPLPSEIAAILIRENERSLERAIRSLPGLSTWPRFASLED